MPIAAAMRDPAVLGTLTDEQLVEDVRRGGGHLFEMLMRRHNRRLYRVVRSVLDREAEIEEVMQQTYEAAFKHLDGFTGAAKFSTWLLRIGMHAALRRRRTLGRLTALQGQADDQGRTQRRTPEDDCGVDELLGLVERAIDRLPPPYKQVLMLRAVEELDTAETAELLAVRDDVVKQRLHRARQLLREDLGAAGDGILHGAFPFLAPRCNRVVAAVLARLTVT